MSNYDRELLLRTNMGVHEGRLRSCVPKVRYGSYNIASKVCRDRQRRGERQIAPYKCYFCGHWHIGKYYPKKILGRLPLYLDELKQGREVFKDGGSPKSKC